MILTELNNWHMTDENHNNSIIIDPETEEEVINPDNCLDFSFGLEEISIVFIRIDNRIYKKEDLDLCLGELKKGTFGINIEIMVKRGYAYACLWRRGDRYLGRVEGILTPDDILASSHFDDAEKFADKWFNWGKKI